MAVVLTGVFYIVNNRILNIPPTTLYDIACHVAESKPQEKDIIVASLHKTFQQYTLPVSVLKRMLKGKK
jgi:hypothetical protein